MSWITILSIFWGASALLVAWFYVASIRAHRRGGPPK